jgi:very-short-patch-repair endonuclease
MGKQHTTEEFIKRCINNHGNIYSFEKTEYVNSLTPLIVTCRKHKHDFTVLAITLLRTNTKYVVGGCPKCREEYFFNIKLDMIEKFKKVHNNEYTYDINSYININKSFYAVCAVHGKFEINGKAHMRGFNKCPKCYPKTKKFINNKQIISCQIHGDVIVGKRRILNEGCPLCKINKHKENEKEKLKNKLENIYGDKYLITVDDKEITFFCKTHNAEKKVLRNGFGYNTFYCDFCFDEYQKSLILPRDKIMVKTTNPYICKVHYSFKMAKELVRKYNITSFREYKKWILRTNQLELPSNPHRIYSEWISYDDFFDNIVKDKFSLGEKKIKNILDKNNVEYEFQKKFKDCFDIKPMPFDFYLPKYNLIIEFDGEQHYKTINGFGGAEKFIITKKHDKMKNDYCTAHSINIIRIKYDELLNDTIESTIVNKIKEIIDINI